MIHRFSGHAGWVTGLAFSPDGRRALSSGEDRVIRLWDLGSRATIREFRGHTDWAISVAFSPDGRLAYSTGGARSVWRDGTDFAVRIWDVEAGRQVGKMEGHRGLVFGLAVSADGRRVLTGGDTIILWNAETRAEIRRFNRHTDKVSRVAFLPIGQRAVSSGWDGTIRLWDLETGQELHCFNAPASTNLALSPDGRTLISSHYNTRELRLWDVGSRKQLDRADYGPANPIWGSFTPDGRGVVWGGGDGVVRVYRLTEANAPSLSVSAITQPNRSSLASLPAAAPPAPPLGIPNAYFLSTVSWPAAVMLVILVLIILFFAYRRQWWGQFGSRFARDRKGVTTQERAQEPLLGCCRSPPLGRSNDSRPSLAATSACHDSEPNG